MMMMTRRGNTEGGRTPPGRGFKTATERHQPLQLSAAEWCPPPIALHRHRHRVTTQPSQPEPSFHTPHPPFRISEFTETRGKCARVGIAFSCLQGQDGSKVTGAKQRPNTRVRARAESRHRCFGCFGFSGGYGGGPRSTTAYLLQY